MGWGVLPQVTPGLIRRDYGTYERGPQTASPPAAGTPETPSWPAGRGQFCPARPRSSTLRALLAADILHLAVSRLRLKAVPLPSSLEKDVSQALPNCAIMACDCDEASGEFFVRTSLTPGREVRGVLWIRPGQGTISPQVDGSKLLRRDCEAALLCNIDEAA